MATGYRVIITAKEVIGRCPVYKPGSKMVIDRPVDGLVYINTKESDNICIHALSALMNLIVPFIHGVAAKDLGMSDKEDVGYARCPAPPPPYIPEESVIFELKREKREFPEY